MKNFFFFLFLILKIVLLSSCAKPTVVEIALPGDAKLNCEQLEDEIAETRKMKRDAEYAKTATGGNTARIMLFWPAWAKTLANADKAIIAADNRNFHLIKLMRKKNCKGVDAINAEITTPTNSNNSNSLAAQLKELKEMYQAGDLTKEEYEKAKRKVLD